MVPLRQTAEPYGWSSDRKWCYSLAGRSGALSRLVELTALLVYLFGLWRLWRYFTAPLAYPEYMLYSVMIAAVVGTGVVCFDEVFKTKDGFVGWAFLFGVGVLSLVVGILFVFFPVFDMSQPIYRIPTSALGLIVFGIAIVVESLLARRVLAAGKHGVNADTVGPILLKITGIFVLFWGIYPLVWVTSAFLYLGISPSQLWQLALLGIGSILVGGVQVAYVESQKRKPQFRKRRLPLLFSFIMLVLALPLLSIFLASLNAGFLFVPTTLMLPISLILGFALVFESFYLIYHPVAVR